VRAAEGASLPELVEEFGRNEGAIRSRLARMDAAASPAD
jgi:DNA-binding transcriptional regulator PaaX